jgi:uncharacterized protein
MKLDMSILEENIIRNISTFFTPKKIYFFGSYIYGNPNKDSDLDIMIVMNSDKPMHKRATDIRLMFDDIKIPMDILVFTPEEVDYWNGTKNHIITEIINKGKLVYEQGN